MDEDYQEQLVAAALRGEQFRVRDGTYVRWSPGEGIEVWLQVRSREVIGVAPHFAGSTSMRVGVTGRIHRPDESPLDGAFHGWADPPPDDPESGDYPFVFDAPDAGRFTQIALPAIVTVQIAAFAHELTAFPDEDAYLASQEGEVRFAAESFIPAGLFRPGATGEPASESTGEPGTGSGGAEGSDAAVPGALAMFSGHVLETRRLENPYSGGELTWARVRTLGGEVDVVADPEGVEGMLVPGGVAHGTFWLSGRLSSDVADPTGEFWRGNGE
jgi:hypothetical protein